MHYLPTFAATVWYYDAVADRPALLDTYFAEVERFAYAAYASALLKSYAIIVEEMQAIAGRIDSRFSGPSLNPLNDVMD